MLSVYDRSAAAIEVVVAETGAAACANPAAVGAASDVVITMLPTGSDVADVVLGGVLDGLPAGVLIVDMSSSAPAETRALGRVVAAAGCRLVDAPVSGGVARAADGMLTIMAGGAPEDVGACTSLFEVLGARTFHMGPLGAGHAAKALNNAVSAAGLVAALEALIVGQAAGVDPGVLLEVLNASTGRNYATENKVEQFVFTRSYASGFALRLMAKDVATATDLARELGVEPAVLDAVGRLVADADGALGDAADHTEVARWLEDCSGFGISAGATARDTDAGAEGQG
jgi:3-hydroxyisobutyrate dehydrogenase